MLGLLIAYRMKHTGLMGCQCNTAQTDSIYLCVGVFKVTIEASYLLDHISSMFKTFCDVLNMFLQLGISSTQKWGYA